MSEQKPISSIEQPPPATAGRDDQVGSNTAGTVRRLIAIILISLGFSAAMSVLFYRQTGTWQLLATAGSHGTNLVLTGIAYLLLHRKKTTAAGFLILLVILMSFIGSELFVGGVTMYIALGGALSFLLVANAALPRRWWAWLGMAGLFLLSLWLINRSEPWPRLDAGQIPQLRPIIVAIVIGVLLAMAIQAGRAYQRIGTIRIRLMVILAATAVLTAFAVSATSMTISQRSGQQQVTRQLESVATLKESEIAIWAQSLQADLAAVIGEEYFTARVAALVGQAPSDADTRRQAHDRLIERLRATVERTGHYESMDLLDTDGVVLLSTEEGQEGKDYGTQSYFRRGLTGPYIQPPVHIPRLGRTVVIAARPVMDGRGKVLGVLAGRANLSALDRIMGERAGLGETGRTYLVGANHALLTGQAGQAITYARSTGIDQAIATGASYRGVYLNNQGIPVIGEARWLPNLQVALIAEQDRAEAFAPILAVRNINIGITLLAVILAVIASVFVAQTIANPLTDLADTARRIAEGDLTRVAPVVREDETGTLAHAFNSMTAQLRELIAGLEQRVAQRTAELQQRTIQLQTATRVARDAAEIRDVGTLLDTTVRLISDRFGFYHAGIFLLDEARERAVLQAASSEGGQRMLARGHKLAVGVGIVGTVASTGEPRIAFDVGQDAAFFNNPDLPLTRSEMALPLKAGGRVIGVLDVQSVEPVAFTEEDVGILHTLADQVALAIENARLLEESRRTLRELETLYGKQAREAWQEQIARRPAAYRYTGVGVEPVPPSLAAEMEVPSPHRQSVVLQEGDRYWLAAPVRLRGQTIGSIVLRRAADEEPWSTDDSTLVEETGAQIALALENARLLEETRHRAAQDRLIREITSRMRESLSMERVLQTAVREIGQSLGLHDLTIQLEMDTDQAG